MKVVRFHHVSVNVNDAELDAVVAFYRDVLGLADEPRPDIPGVPGHWHGVGPQQLHIVGAQSAGAGIDPTGNHYCVTVAALAGAVAELDVQGEGVVQIWIADPAGNTIELQQETPTP